MPAEYVPTAAQIRDARARSGKLTNPAAQQRIVKANLGSLSAPSDPLQAAMRT
jgi:hypothetical protein